MQSLNINIRRITLAFALVNFIYLQVVVASEAPTDDSSNEIIHRTELLTIENAIERALEFAPKLQSAASRMDAAQGAQLQASLLPNPELAFEA